MAKKIAFIMKEKDRFRQSEVIRSSLGITLAVDHKVSLFLLDEELKRNAYIDENLEFLQEMDGKIYSNNPKNEVEQLSLEDIAKKLLENDIIIPF
jgi:hypothetical protein